VSGGIVKSNGLLLLLSIFIWADLVHGCVKICILKRLSVYLLLSLAVCTIILAAIVLTAEPFYFSFDLVLNKVGVS